MSLNKPLPNLTEPKETHSQQAIASTMSSDDILVASDRLRKDTLT
ncbi:MAG TPA: hypothetical protein ACFE0H_07445 [Elainellaceae cyanobacterium]